MPRGVVQDLAVGRCGECGGEFEMHQRVQRFCSTRCRRRWGARTPKARERGRYRRAGIASAVAMLKLDRGCADCGFDMHPGALDFDHIDRGAKSFTVAEGVALGFSIETLLSEIVKCVVRCANCHRIRSLEDGRSGAPFKTLRIQ